MKTKGLCVLGLSWLALSVPGMAQSFAYVTNSSSNNISAYSIDPTTGVLTPIAGSPFAAGPEPNSVTIDPTGRFLYTSNESTSSTIPSTVSAYTINAVTGALTPVAGSPFAAGIEPNTARAHPTGRFLYVPNEVDRTISAYAINSGTGALTPIAGSPFATGATGDTDSIAIDPSGRFAYVSQDSTPGFVLAFTIDPSTGALTPVAGSPFAAGTSTDFTVVDPSGRFVYAPNFGSMDISAYTINSTTGALTPILGSPFATGGGRPDAVTVDPFGRFLYAADDSGVAKIAAFTINSGTGALTPIAGSPFAAGTSPSGIAEDNTGKFLYAANENSGDVSAYTINSTTGALTPVAGSPFAAGTEPGAIVTTPAALTGIPTLSQWGLALLSILLAGFGAIYVGKRRMRRLTAL